MIVLAIDTAANLCAACIHDSRTDRETGRAVRDIGKGHAEHVMAVVEAALGEAGLGYDGLDAIAVCTGPGSFTGVRVGVAAARGLALALKIPAIGVNALEALAAQTRPHFPGRAVLAATGQRPAQLFAAGFGADGAVLFAPAVLSAEALAGWAGAHDAVLCGSAHASIAEAAGESRDIGATGATADIAVYARLAGEKGTASEKPRPLYLRAPDARPQADFALPRRGT